MSNKFTDNILNKIEKIYAIDLPEEFITVYKSFDSLPNNWYDWSAFSSDNIQMLKNYMQEVKEDLAEELDYIDWNDNWGEYPQDSKIAHKFILEKLSSAPSLLPISGHRYIAAEKTPVSPVFSVVGSDIIYYSASLTDFLNGLTISQDTNLSTLTTIPFWSEIAQ